MEKRKKFVSREKPEFRVRSVFCRKFFKAVFVRPRAREHELDVVAVFALCGCFYKQMLSFFLAVSARAYYREFVAYTVRRNVFVKLFVNAVGNNHGVRFMRFFFENVAYKSRGVMNNVAVLIHVLIKILIDKRVCEREIHHEHVRRNVFRLAMETCGYGFI